MIDGQPAATRVSQNAMLIAFFSVVSRLLGVLRDRLLATTFGAGATLDAYYAAFKLPDFIFNTFVLGALSAALIPVLVRTREQSGQQASWKIASTVLTLLTAGLAVAALVGIIFADKLVPLVAPGFSEATTALSIHLTRVMLASIVFFGASNVLGSVAQANERFGTYAIAPAVYNTGIILGILLLVPMFGPLGLAYGVLLGSILHLLTQLPGALNAGWRFVWGRFNDPGVKEFFKLLGPRTLGLAAYSLNDIITASFLSYLGAGTLAAFAFASNLHSFPINVFGVSLAVAAFPVFSQAISRNETNHFAEQFGSSVRRVLFFVLPMAVLFLVLRAQIVRVVLGAGEFDWTDTIRTAQVVGFLGMAMISDSLIPLLARSFYALKDTVTPVICSLISIGVNVGLLLLLRPYGLTGIGVAYVSASLVNAAALSVSLGRRVPNLPVHTITSAVMRMVPAAVVAGGVAYAMLRLVAPLVNMQTFVGIAAQGVSAGVLGLVAYVVVTSAFRLPEVAFVKQYTQNTGRVVARLWKRSAIL